MAPQAVWLGVSRRVLGNSRDGLFGPDGCKTSGQLGGYAADVFDFEDWARSDRPEGISANLLSAQSSTLFTPHLGSAVDEARREIALEAARNILQAFQGKTPSGAINQVGI